MSADREPWVDYKPVVAYLHYGKSTIYELARRGEIPCLPLPAPKNSKGRGRVSYRFRMSEIEKWAEARARAHGRGKRGK